MRGGILDVFPAHETEPFRLEYIGDTIETIRAYDPGTQRSIRPVDRIAIIPLSDVLDDERAERSSTISRGCPSGECSCRAGESIAALEKLAEQIQRSYDTATSRNAEPAEGESEDSGPTQAGTTMKPRRRRTKTRRQLRAFAPLADERF